MSETSGPVTSHLRGVHGAEAAANPAETEALGVATGSGSAGWLLRRGLWSPPGSTGCEHGEGDLDLRALFTESSDGLLCTGFLCKGSSAVFSRLLGKKLWVALVLVLRSQWRLTAPSACVETSNDTVRDNGG